ncbi:MAG: (2Fe-2S)-binding protein [Rickettsiales bacterium]|jgi:predicted molibdopterin-dependent oxidoreductase YjgC
MFRRITESKTDTITLHFEGRRLQVPAGETVAAAILAAEPTYTRTTAVSGEKRAPYCMMGTCFECLMEIDGVGNRQACLTLVADGMQVRRQQGKREMPE